jgi:hypothetical protein
MLALYLACRACIERSTAMRVAAEDDLTAAQAYGQRQTLNGSHMRSTATGQSKPEKRSEVVKIARRMLAARKPRRGLAGRIAQERHNDGAIPRKRSPADPPKIRSLQI